MNIKRVLQVSRPRFWVYEWGSFWGIGVFAAMSVLFVPGNIITILVWAFYFLVPANILIYGVNDIYDYETDKKNPKKVAYEALVEPSEQKKLWKWIVLTNLPFLIFVPWHNIHAVVALFVFVFCAVFYSAKPIRAKVRPFFDSLFSAGHYIATAVFGYYLSGGQGFPVYGVCAGLLWAIAMHAYSAVPDIKADADAGLETIATKLGRNRTIIFCILCYVFATVFYFKVNHTLSLIFGVLYVLLMIASYKTKDEESLFRLYTYFPMINLLTGFGVFVGIFLPLLQK